MDRRRFLSVATHGAAAPLALGVFPGTVAAFCDCGDEEHSEHDVGDDDDSGFDGVDRDFGPEHDFDGSNDFSARLEFSFFDQRERAATGGLLGGRDLRDTYRDAFNDNDFLRDLDFGLRAMNDGFDKTYADETIGLLSDGMEAYQLGEKLFDFGKIAWGFVGKAALGADLIISGVKTYNDVQQGMSLGSSVISNFTPLDEAWNFVVMPAVEYGLRPAMNSAGDAMNAIEHSVVDFGSEWLGPQLHELQRNIEGLYYDSLRQR